MNNSKLEFDPLNFLMMNAKPGFYIVTTQSEEAQYAIKEVFVLSQFPVYDFACKDSRCSSSEFLQWADDQQSNVFVVTNMQNGLHSGLDIRIFARSCRELAPKKAIWIFCMTESVGILLATKARMYRYWRLSIHLKNSDVEPEPGFRGYVEPPCLSVSLEAMLNEQKVRTQSNDEDEIRYAGNNLYAALLDYVAYSHFARDTPKSWHKALHYYRDLYAFVILTMGKNHPLAAKALNNIGALYCDCLKDSAYKGLKYLQEALAIREKAYGIHHEWTANTYLNIGLIYRNIQHTDIALHYFHSAFEAQKEALEPYHYRIMKTQLIIARTYEDLGEYIRAYLSYEGVLKILRRRNHFGKEWIREEIISFTQLYFPRFVERVEYFCVDIIPKKGAESHPPN